MHNVHRVIHTVYSDAWLFYSMAFLFMFTLGSEMAALWLSLRYDEPTWRSWFTGFNDNPEWRGWSMGTYRSTDEDSVGREGVDESGRA